MGKLYFITRTFPGIAGIGGGALIRKKQVDLFNENGFDTWIIAPNYTSKKSIIDRENKMLLFPFSLKKHYQNSLLEKVGLKEDYYDEWIRNALAELKNIITSDDVLFCVSGGEMGSIILGSKLKTLTGCMFIANFHDPVLNATVFNKKVRLKGSRLFHINRDPLEKKYLSNADYLYTSSDVYKASLQEKYPALKEKIRNSYFGYIHEYCPAKSYDKLVNKPVKIGYGGSMGAEQSPEILAKAVETMKGVEAYFFGDVSNNTYLNKPRKNVVVVNYMPHDAYLDFMHEYIDLSFFSLDGDLSTLCVPSKLYEYVNLGIPMVAAVKGDAADIVTMHRFGISCKYTPESVRHAIDQLMNKEKYENARQAILQEKYKWSMNFQSRELICQIAQLLDK